MRSSLLFSIFLLIFSCQNQSKPKENFQLSTSDYVVLKYNSQWHWVFKDVTPSDLNKKELIQIEKILQSAIEEHNKYFINDNEGFKQWGLELSRYKRQYVPVINQKGEKIIWINFFCQDSNSVNWKIDIPIVADGGNCYFNLKINLTTKQYSDLRINGYA